jgi:hypothetical protein
LDGAVDRQVLAAACDESAVRLSRELERNALAYREIALEAGTEDGPVDTVKQFGRHQAPANLRLHLDRLLTGLRITAPVESLTVTVGGLEPAPAAQMSLFDGKDPLREERLRRVCAVVNRKHELIRASSVQVDRREKMFSFHDPFRRAGTAGERTQGGQ